jgi:hypothetical protein
MPVKSKAKTKVQKKSNTEGRGKSKSSVQAKARTKASRKKKTMPAEKAQVVNRISAPRIEERKSSKSGKAIKSPPQYSFMKAPGNLHDFQVGKKIEVYCDHDKSKERIRGWIDGTIVQVDNKMVAVQFRSNVYLTDGWMVPDRILWSPLNSEHVRPVGGAKPAKKDRAILDY